MHILCTICSDLVNQAESLFVTKCGHIFHHHCLSQWIERSKSCPQCRNKVTERCMFRMYPTVSAESSAEDAATLQARLDDAMLQLRTQAAAAKELNEQLATVTDKLSKKEEQLSAAESRLASREAAASVLRIQLTCARAQADDATRLKEDNDRLTRNIETLNGLQKVLNATADEVEEMLRGYSDPRTVATFAAALKRALCESESKKREWRKRQLDGAQQLAAAHAQRDELRHKLREAEERIQELKRKCSALEHKRKAGELDARAAKHPRPAPSPPHPAAPSPAPTPSPSPSTSRLEDSFCEQSRHFLNSILSSAECSGKPESPYLQLRQGSVALAAALRVAQHKTASEPASAPAARPANSIFGRSAPLPRTPPPATYDGLGGHERPDPSPAPRALPRAAPRLTARHRLKKFDPAGSRDIKTMFERDK